MHIVRFAVASGAALGLLLSTGCSVTVRNITAQTWAPEPAGVYVGYWEGDCKAVLGCGVGDGKLQWCSLQDDNALVCTEQTEVSALLAAKKITTAPTAPAEPAPAEPAPAPSGSPTER